MAWRSTTAAIPALKVKPLVDYAIQSGHDEGADFDFGISLILDGLERLLV